KEICCKTLPERIEKLIEIGDAYIILPGGTGTFLELAMVWESFNKNILKIKPVSCLGEMWKKIVDVMEERIKKENRKTNLIGCYDTIEECVEYIEKYFS
ncbi:MAG: LOG family protein, partial [Ignavibacteriales bacterium]|nr:LOG family protein [Ignavibacteriales bacterium]